MAFVNIFFSILSFAVIFISCGQNEISHKLEIVNSFLDAQKADSAYIELQKINVENLSEHDEAYYNLLATKVYYLTYLPIQSDSIINESIEYYKKEKDNLNLGEAYYYKGMIEQLLGESDSAIISLKESETIASKLSEIKLKHKVYNGLVSLNYATANYTLALEYARKELAVSEMSGNGTWIAYAYNHLSCIHDKMGNKDSVYMYIKRVMPYINEVPEDAKTYHLSNIGQYYLHYGDTQEAKKYLTMAYNIKPIPETVKVLSGIFYAENEKQKALDLLNTASEMFDLEGKIKIYETLAEIYYLEKDYEISGKITAKLKCMKDSLEQFRRTYVVHELQLQYDNNRNMEVKRLVINKIWIGSGALILSVLVGILFYKRRRYKENRRTKKLIHEYEYRINELETSEGGLVKKLEELKSNDTQSLSSGYALFKSILNGGTTLEWNKTDFDCFVRYYQVVSPQFFSEMEKKYNGLSLINKTLLILYDIGFDNEQIKHAMCMSAGALRAARFRVRAKEK